MGAPFSGVLPHTGSWLEPGFARPMVPQPPKAPWLLAPLPSWLVSPCHHRGVAPSSVGSRRGLRGACIGDRTLGTGLQQCWRQGHGGSRSTTEAKSAQAGVSKQMPMGQGRAMGHESHSAQGDEDTGSA